MKQWLKDAVFYEIYPQSFYDTNADGIGDLEGVIRKLPYIKELGCNAIWLNPCFVSPFFDAGYDVEDYMTVAPRYGTNADMRRLFEEAHSLGIRVLLDLVPGHTALTHPWFKESMKPERNAWSGRYIWTDSIDKGMEGVAGISNTIKGISQRDGVVGLNCFFSQPALNYGFYKADQPWQFSMESEEAEATRKAMEDVMDFWLGMGCDGFRVDMAGSLVKNDENGQGTIALWQKFRAFLDEKYPEAALVSEWGMPAQAIKAGFDMDFLLHFGGSDYMDLFRTDHPYFGGDSEADVSRVIGKYIKSMEETKGKGLICIPTGNHDMDRISYHMDENGLKLAYAFLMSMPGAPFIYYGDEIGMKYLSDIQSVEGGYSRTGSRTPMQWDGTTNAGFSSAPSDKLYIRLDPDQNRPNVETQQKDENSVYHTLRKLIGIRRSHEALQSFAEVEFLYVPEKGYPFVYKRRTQEEEILVVLNPSACEARCPVFSGNMGEVLYEMNGRVRQDEKQWIVPARSAGFYRI